MQAPSTTLPSTRAARSGQAVQAPSTTLPLTRAARSGQAVQAPSTTLPLTRTARSGQAGQVFSLGMTTHQITPATRPFNFAQGRLYAGKSKEMQGQAAVAYPSITFRTAFVLGKHSD